tara:strand:- start:83923 stop:84150 length:228 start_codon:yes stop_codon:yes gene_type:complete
MSFYNRQEEIDKALKLKIDEEFTFNMICEQGALIKRVGDNAFELYETNDMRDMYHDTYTKENLLEAVDLAYDKWT